MARRSSIQGSGQPAIRLRDVIDEVTAGVSQETVEVIRSLAIELVPDTADQLATQGAAAEVLRRAPEMMAGDLRRIIAGEYAWALGTDLNAAGTPTSVWYRSQDAEEPRRGHAGRSERRPQLGA